MEKTILYPMVAQGALIFGVLLLLMKRRFKAVSEGKSDLKYFRLFEGRGEPDDVTVVQRNFINQFEVPVLFFIVCLMAAVFDRADSIMVYAAWAFVALRLVHAIVHIHRNDIRKRYKVFFASNFVLMFMWVWVAL